MTNPLSNRKKVRGWKRRLRQLERFRAAHLRLDVDTLRDLEVQYVKLWLDPWSRLVPRNPPYWYRRRILEAFLEIERSWHATLRQLGEPFYLRLWLFHPEFHRTQVVAALGSRILHYQTLFPPAEHAPRRPPAEYADPAYELDALAWEVGRNEEWYAPPPESGEEEVARYTRGASRVEHTAGGDTFFVFDHGLVWQGSTPGGRGPGGGALRSPPAGGPAAPPVGS